MKNRTYFYKDEDVKYIDTRWGKAIEIIPIGAYELPYETKPTKGEHDFNTCDECQKSLAKFKKQLTERFEGNNIKKGFPFCCEDHEKLIHFKEFNKNDFSNVPIITANKIIYTYNHIKNNYNSDDYYKDITDYIVYTKNSFGLMPNYAEPLFLTQYLDLILDLIDRDNDISKERKKRLLEFINALKTPNKTPKTDLNILFKIYDDWLKIFPFDLSFFNKLKPDFERIIPLFKDESETNKYTKVKTYKAHTKQSLIDELLKTTDLLLTRINSLMLYEKGQLKKPLEVKLELVISERKSKIKEGYFNSSPNEDQRFRKILKEWFADEKKFIEEIIPIIKEFPSQAIETKNEIFDFEKELSQIKISENKFWKGLLMDRVIEHFKILTENKNKNNEPYLTQQQFVSFLKKGFLFDTNQPIQKINFTYGEKGFVIKRFYELYDIACTQFMHPNKKETFVQLVFDCFDNLGDIKSINNLFKPNKTKEKW